MNNFAKRRAKLCEHTLALGCGPSKRDTQANEPTSNYIYNLQKEGHSHAQTHTHTHTQTDKLTLALGCGHRKSDTQANEPTLNYINNFANR